ncbi:MAG: alanine racemase [Lachnospiraceae bacterium]|nr:alanine racemase [Lachnospiraceae bacterium]
MKDYSRVYAQVDLSAILHNVNEMKRVIPADTQILAVIKTDGYGHGAVPIGRLLEQEPGIWGYGVATAEEGLILRRNGLRKPILVLGATFPEQYRDMAEQGIRPNVYSLAMAEDMSRALAGTGHGLHVHVKVDTGLSRLGFQVTRKDADEIAQIAGLEHIILEGLFTHYAKADAADKSMAENQLSLFQRMQRLLQERGVSPKLTHSSNSAAIIDMPHASMDLVRAGISLYGLLPSDEVDQGRLSLRPALSLKSRIVFLKELEEGRAISYGATYRTDRVQRIATIPVGYGDGYPRSLSNRGYVLIRGQRAPICGRICMDQFMVDVTKIPEAALMDEVVLVGESGQERITMEQIGRLSGRFHYEFACDLGKRIPRVYLKNGAIVETRDYFGE